MLTDIRACPMSLVCTTNSTTAGVAFAGPASKTTVPSGTGVIPMGYGGSIASPGLFLLPFGVGADTNTFLMGVFGWEVLPGSLDSTTTSDLWVAHILAGFTCTMTTITGVANTRVSASNRFCDTIAVTVGNANVSCEAVSPTGDEVGSVLVDSKGCQFVEVLFWMNGSATSANALYRRV